MLVLTRKVGERIRIGDDVWVTIVRVKGNNVGLGIEAPTDVRIAREEICETAVAGDPRRTPRTGDAA